jgi:hypothetical protein
LVSEYPHARHVLAVVTCWGRIVAGTRGIRSEHARIEALTLSAAVPPDLAAAVLANYPSIAFYPDASIMLNCHRPRLWTATKTHAPR